MSTPPNRSYEETRRIFRWHIPENFNAAIDSLDRQCGPGADPDRTALITTIANGSDAHFSYSDLKRLSDLLASAFVSLMVEAETCVATLLPHGLEMSLSALATLKAGGVIAPMGTDWSTAQLIKAVQTAKPRVLITCPKNLNRARIAAEACDPSPTLLCTSSPNARIKDFWVTLYGSTKTNIRAKTHADAPAFIVFSQGRTEEPKAIVHAHRAILGHLTALEYAFEDVPSPGDMLWSTMPPSHPMGLISGLFAPWLLGIPVLAMEPPQTTADTEKCFSKIALHGVRLALLTPKAITAMQKYPAPREQFNFALRSVVAIGGRLPKDAESWCQTALGVPLEKVYGEAETGPIAFTHVHWFHNTGAKCLGRAAPGANIDIVDDDGKLVPLGGIGHIAIPQDHPGICIRHKGSRHVRSRWARRKYVAKWFLTDDIASMDEDSNLTFVAKADDILPHGESGYLPDDVERILRKHNLVVDAAVLSRSPQDEAPDVVTVIKPVENFPMGDIAAETILAKDILKHASKALAPYAIPRRFIFVKTIPKTDEARTHLAMLRLTLRHATFIDI